MGQHVSPEFKQLHGNREADDDGFTYRYGRHKGGYTKRPRHTNTIKRMVRNDKRSVRTKETRRINAEVDF
jgi:hypothetical protein